MEYYSLGVPEPEEQEQSLITPEDARLFSRSLAGISGLVDGALITAALAYSDISYIVPGIVITVGLFVVSRSIVNESRVGEDESGFSSHHHSSE